MMRRFLILSLLPVWTAGTACDAPESDAVPRATGYVEATEVQVSSKIAGRVERVAVAEGDRIEAGAEVAAIWTTDLDLGVNRVRAERAQAEAGLRLLVAGSRAEDLAQAQAQAAAATAEIAAFETEVVSARTDEARFAQLVQSRAGSEKQLDDARARRLQAEARLQAAKDRAAAAEATRARLAAGTRPEEIAAARARLAAVDATLATLEHDRSEALIRAPSGGVVTSRLVEPGELVGAGAPVAVVIDLDRAWVNAYVEEPLVPALRIGGAAVIVTDAGDRLDGRIAFIAPRAEFTPRNVQTASERAKLVYRVKISTDNRQGVLKPGMPVEVELQGAGQ
jgi:HlyD family secretion protein